MPILLVPLSAEQLSRHFNAQTVAILCNHVCNRLLVNIDLPTGVSPEGKTKIQVMIEKVRIYLGNIGRHDTDQNVAETPRIVILCVTVLQKALGGASVDTVVAQFDLTKEGLAEVHPSHVLTFLLVLLKESVYAMKNRYPQTQRLSAIVTEYLGKIDQMIRELAPIIGAPPAWATGPNVIDPQTTVLLRLKVGVD